jgi:nitroreductase
MGENHFEPLEFTTYSSDEMIRRSRSFYETIKRRRTVREFSGRTVPREVIENALRAAGTAPSGANSQPWQFVVVSDPETKREIRVAAEAEEREFYERRASEEWLEALEPWGTDDQKPFLEDAPCLIVVFLKKFNVDDQGNRRKTYYPIESVGIATGMLITALHMSGLATLTHTPSPMKFLNEILDRPDYERPFVILVTGYPSDSATVPVLGKQPLDRIATFIE